MTRKRSRIPSVLGVALLILLFGCLPASAQRRGARSAPASGMRSASGHFSGTAVRRNAGVSAYSGYGFGGVGSTFYGNSWPSQVGLLGQGQNLGIEAAINPATQLKLAFAQRFLRNNVGLLGGGGYYLLDGGGAYAIPSDSDEPAEPPQEPQPQVVVLQQAPPQTTPTQDAAEQQPPIPDEGEFTLVLQGGKQIQAAAFTQSNGRIVYITPDGTRHSIAVTDLDRDATARINEERGTPLQLHL